MHTSDADQNLSTNLLRSTVLFFVLPRTPADAYYSALFLPKTKATIHIFSYKQAELLLLTDVRHPGRRDRSPFKSPSATAATRGDRPLAKKKLTVLATGDSCYWPGPEDAYYDNEPGKDFNTRLERPGAGGFVESAGRQLQYGSQSCGNPTHQAPRNLPTEQPRHPR